ncbi:MAG: hypothetical protein NTX25_16590 [Proteobacteria bacterium]|nr:hypothetical protein [Pseudomonadota bacterium]
MQTIAVFLRGLPDHLEVGLELLSSPSEEAGVYDPECPRWD